MGYGPFVIGDLPRTLSERVADDPAARLERVTTILAAPFQVPPPAGSLTEVGRPTSPRSYWLHHLLDVRGLPEYTTILVASLEEPKYFLGEEQLSTLGLIRRLPKDVLEGLQTASHVDPAT